MVRTSPRPRSSRLAAAAFFAASCQPDPGALVADVEELGPLPQSTTIRGRDGGYSALAFGRSVWVFGDTVLEMPDVDGETWHTNSVSSTDDLDARDGVGAFVEPRDDAGAPRLFLPFTADELAYNAAHLDTDQARKALWPGPMVADPTDSLMIGFYMKLDARPGDFNFEQLGTGVYRWTSPESEPERIRVDRVPDDPTLLWDASPPPLGHAALVHEGMLVSYGCRGTEKPCVAARVSPSQVADPDAWRYFDGEDWVADPRRAKTIFHGHDILSVHRMEALGLFIAVYSEPLSASVRFRTAPAPEGPWSDQAELFRAERAPDGATPYSALAHPEYDDGGTLLVTYFRETGFLAGELMQVRVRLE